MRQDASAHLSFSSRHCQGFKYAEVALVSPQCSSSVSCSPAGYGHLQSRQTGVEELKALKETWRYQWKTPTSTKWERWPLCWWYGSLDRNVRLCCQVLLPVPASEITAFGAVAATQEAEETPVSSGKKFAQLCIQCVLVAGLLSPACP